MTPTTTPSPHYFFIGARPGLPILRQRCTYWLTTHSTWRQWGEVYLQHSPELLAWLAQELGQTDLEATRVVFCCPCTILANFHSAFRGSGLIWLSAYNPMKAAPSGLLANAMTAWGWHFGKPTFNPKTDHETWFGDDPEYYESLNFWARAVMGHHGQPPKETVPHLHRHFRAADVDAALGFTEAMRALLLPPEAARVAHSLDADTFDKISSELSWWVAGLAVLADWIGSNADIFAYCDTPQLTLQDYWHKALGLAAQALSQSEVVSPGRAGRNALYSNSFPPFRSHRPCKFGLPLLNWQTAHKFIC